MILLGEKKLRLLANRKYPDAIKWINIWIAAVKQSEWHSIIEVRKEYPSADGIKLGVDEVVTIFNVRGNKYRLVTSINYGQQKVMFDDLMTHAEYDKQKWKR
jgi:mRNA interferase HigB